MAGLGLPLLTWRGRLGLGAAALGLALMASSGGYYLYSRQAVASLGRLAVPASPAAQELPAEWRAAQSGRVSSAGAAALVTPGTLPTRSGLAETVEPAASVPGPSLVEPPLRWADWATLPRTLGKAPRPTRVAIPAIDVDSPVVEVAVVWDGDQQVWQRPKRSVGHHVGTASPGELGNVVLSGHINSPVRGEGSVFRRLLEIPERLRAGEPIEVLVYTEDRTYVYRIVQSEVLEPDEVRPFDPTERPTLTLVTCVPDLVFSHRLTVTGLLVKVGEGGRPWAGQRVEGQAVSPVQ